MTDSTTDVKPPAVRGSRLDDVAYIAPMAAFLAIMWVGGRWPGLYVASFGVRIVVVGGLIAFFWKSYTRIRWNWAWVGLIFGVIGVVQWVGVEELLLKYWPNYPRIPSAAAPFDPREAFAGSPAKLWGFILMRIAEASLVVPVMEELFWRDFLWRTVAAPNDFKLAKVGEWDWQAFVFVAVFCTSVHPQWITAIIWCIVIGLMLVWTKSLGACIIAHAVTNCLLGVYVLMSGKWYYW